jgi:hypothetical protein
VCVNPSRDPREVRRGQLLDCAFDFFNLAHRERSCLTRPVAASPYCSPSSPPGALPPVLQKPTKETKTRVAPAETRPRLAG